MQENKYLRLNGQEDTVNEALAELKGFSSMGELLDAKDRLAKNNKSKKIKKICKKMKKEVRVLKKDIKRLKKSTYDNKLAELVACNDPAERKKIAAELKKDGGVSYA